MKLNLEIYTDVLLLTVQEAVSGRAAQVMNAGFKKIAELPVEWIFVDLSTAQIDLEGAKALLLSMMSRAPSPGIKKVFYIGNVPRLCEYLTLEDALAACPSPEARLLKDKVKMDREVQKLRERKAMILAEIQQKTGSSNSGHKLRAENRQVKRVSKTIVREINAAQKVARAVQTRKPDPELILEMGKTVEGLKKVLIEEDVP